MKRKLLSKKGGPAAIKNMSQDWTDLQNVFNTLSNLVTLNLATVLDDLSGTGKEPLYKRINDVYN